MSNAVPQGEIARRLTAQEIKEIIPADAEAHALVWKELREVFGADFKTAPIEELLKAEGDFSVAGLSGVLHNKENSGAKWNYVPYLYLYLASKSAAVPESHRTSCEQALARLATSLHGGITPELEFARRYSPSAQGPALLFPTLRAPFEGEEEDASASWLSPLVADALPFHGRATELRSLDRFFDDPRSFAVWAISGPSGGGKTRLVVEWLRNLKARDNADTDKWNVGFLTSENLHEWREQSDGDWQHWIPSQPTVMIFDYLHLFSGELRQVFERGAALAKLPRGAVYVRILLVDHIMPEDLYDIGKDVRFAGIGGRGVVGRQSSDFFFRSAPLFLRPSEQSWDVLLNVMESAARWHGLELPYVVALEGLEELRGMTGAWCPLFAALRGYAFAKRPQDRFKGPRRGLIVNFLDTDKRLPWRSRNPEMQVDGLWAGILVAAATAVRGAKLTHLFAPLPDKVKFDGTRLKKITSIARWLISSDDPAFLPPFEPDILGETLFLIVLGELVFWSSQRQALINMIRGAAQSGVYDVELQFVGFIHRMLRNLDDEDVEWRRPYLSVLMEGLHAAREAVSPTYSMGQAFLVAFVEAKTHFPRPAGWDRSHARSLQLDVDVMRGLEEACWSPLAAHALVAVSRWYDEAVTAGVENADEIFKVCLHRASAYLSRYFEVDLFPFFLACMCSGVNGVLQALSQDTTAMNRSAGSHQKPLWAVILRGDADVIEALLNFPELVVNPDHASIDPADWFAPLSFAASRGNANAVAQLLNRDDIDVNQRDRDGMTALDHATIDSQFDVVGLLLADPRTNRGMTPGLL